MDPKKTICALRWMNPVINISRPEVKSCCHTEYEVIPKEDMEKYGTDVFLNTDKLKKDRYDLIKGVRSKDCSSCWMLEDKGVHSPRQGYEMFANFFFDEKNATPENIENFKENFADWAESVTPDSPALRGDRPFMLDINLGNLCNLKCMYCHHGVSSQWGMENIKYGELDKDYYDRIYNTEYPEYEELFWKWFNETAKYSVGVISISGGEPLITPKFYDVLDKINDAFKDLPDRRKKVVIGFSTNLNTPENYFKKFLNYVPKLDEYFILHMFVSMEGLGKQAEYIRNGLDWNLFESNIRTILEGQYNLQLNFQITINTLNIPHLKEFLMWLKSLQEEFDKELIPFQNIVKYPDWQSPLILTPDFADYLYDTIDWLNDIIPKLKDYNNTGYFKWKDYPNYLLSIAEGIKADNADVELRKKFYRWFKQYDERRELNLLETFPLHKDFWTLCETLSKE